MNALPVASVVWESLGKEEGKNSRLLLLNLELPGCSMRQRYLLPLQPIDTVCGGVSK